jgi:DNA mismatch endonuclease Vsr
MPASNRQFWRNKLEGNAARDKRNAARLRRAGWRVFTVWECRSSDPRRLAKLLRDILNA